MIFKANSSRLCRFAAAASLLAVQALPWPQYSHADQERRLKREIVASNGAMSPIADRVRFSKQTAAEVRRGLPLAFEANHGQAGRQVKYLSRAGGFNLYLTAKEAIMNLRGATPRSPHEQKPDSPNANLQSSALKMKLVGASDAALVTTLDELPGKSNYFIGDDPKKWRTSIPTYSGVKFHSVYPGVDVSYYGDGRELEYDFIVAPGASFKTIALSFEGADGIRLDDSGDLLIETAVGEIRQRKPVIYQEQDGVRQAISGGYVVRGNGEVAFEVGGYDRSRAVVIDPVFVYSTSIGGLGDDSARAVAMDAAGNAYIAGVTSSVDFPAVNAVQSSLKSIDAFVLKLNPSGTAIVYSTFLGGAIAEAANAIAVDPAGNAYVAGSTGSSDFPTTAGAFQTEASEGGGSFDQTDAFITKLNSKGDALAYSTYLGAPTRIAFISTKNVARGIAVDQEGSAYVAGYTSSDKFPLKRPAQSVFNKGAPFSVSCLEDFGLPRPSIEDAFITKLDPTGARLVYSTYVGGGGTDEAYGIAIDSTGSAYICGATCSGDFPSTAPGTGRPFLVKLSPSGKTFVYAFRFGGRGRDLANGVAVDSEGAAYVTGWSDSDDFPTTASAFQRRLGGSVVYSTEDGGASWRSVSGFPNSTASSIAIDPTNPLRMYATVIGRFAGSGVLYSIDGGETWTNSPFGPPFPGTFPSNSALGVAVDPNDPSVLYTDRYKSTSRGASWTLMQFPSGGGFGPTRIFIDPTNSSTVYLLAVGGPGGDVVFPPRFLKTTDSGSTWDFIRNGTNLFGPSSAVLDPKNPLTIYAASADLFKSTDAGKTWRVPYEGRRNFHKLAIDPSNAETLYLADANGGLFKTTDAGATFAKLADLGITINDLQVDPKNSSIVYAAAVAGSRGGAVFKSTDAGQTWNVTDLIGASVNTIAIDPLNPSRIFAAVDFDVDGFVIKTNPAGSALAYSTYLGSRSPDLAASIGVDGLANAWVTGRTLSDRFPRNDALQAIKPTGRFDVATFATKFDAAGSQILFSTYAGGSEPSVGLGIAVNSAGKVCIVGTTDSRQVFPTGASLESVHGRSDAFAIKIAAPPRITGVSTSGKNLIVSGEGFDNDAVILVDGVEQRTRNDASKPATMLIGKKAAKNISPGQQVGVRVRNPDGLQSELFSFTR